LTGRITFDVCSRTGGATTDGVPDTAREKIFVDWWARYTRTSPEEVSWSGAFRIAGGTGTYQDLTGNGQISGYFFCFAPQGCAALGNYGDGQYVMIGNYADPTVPSVT
jgi:hypothetical protein